MIAEHLVDFWVFLIVGCIIWGVVCPSKSCKCHRGACSRYDEN